MKKIFFLTGILFSLYSYGQLATTTGNNTLKYIAAVEIPAAVLTPPESYWTISTISSVGYVNTTPGSDYNSYKGAGGMIVKFRFLKNNRFEFLLYVQSNTYGTDIETWTQFSGTVVFSKDSRGQEVFTTRAEKGVYRVIRNGAITTRAIPENELKGQHSNTYLWETASFKDDPDNTYLLMVNLDDHPGIDIRHPDTINPEWVSKFHIPHNK